jgi:hypothetical protein
MIAFLQIDSLSHTKIVKVKINVYEWPPVVMGKSILQLKHTASILQRFVAQ